MKRLKKGPEINLSKLKSGDLKVPSALSDLYKELKGQHLLPVVVLLVLGLIAIPVLIGGSSDHERAPQVATQNTIGGSSSEQAALKVSQWTPGLLDYKKTLRGATPSNPFAAKVAPVETSESGAGEVEPAPAPSEIEVAPETGTGGGGASEESSPSESPGPVEQPTSPGEGQEEGGNGGEESPKNESGAITIDVQVTTIHEEGGVDRSPVRRNLPHLTKLPSEATPALTYVGPSEDGTKAMMAVSSEVTAMIGDSNCVVPAKPCSLLALQVGMPETIVYGPRGLTYRIELVRIGDHTASDAAKKKSQAPKGSNSTDTPAPREADALIGIGSFHVAQRWPGP